jgi:hypothetical protein
MAVLVDYRCRSCGSREEHWAPSPPPPSVRCGGCGAESHRTWAPIGLSGVAGASPATPAPRAGGPRRSICAQYPQVPGLCHMSESAGRMWVAKYRRDGRAADHESERQEKQAALRPPTMADAITQHHHSGPSSTTGAPLP